MIIKIKNHTIGEKTFIIAEAGINHNGEISLAKELIHQAKLIGANAIKFQTYKTENLLIKNKKTKDLFQLLKKYELSFDDFRELKDFAQKEGIVFLSTPDDIESFEFLLSLHLPAYKIGSGEIDNYYFQKLIAMSKKTIILSTGTASFQEIKKAFFNIYKINKKLILLHCISEYPANINSLNLNFIETLKKQFKIPIGFSDHSLSLIIPSIAITKGASVIEKHFTLDNSLIGPDHKMSLNIDNFKKMIEYIRETESALGKYDRIVTKKENQLKPQIRKSIFSKTSIIENEKLNNNNTILLRPQIGIKASMYEYFFNKKFIKKKNPYKPIRVSDIEK